MKFTYDNIEGEIKIIQYNREDKKIYVEYNNNLYKVGYFLFKRNELGILFNKRTKEFKIKIGQVFKDNKRDITIIEREYRKDKNRWNIKWYKYKYKCNKCGNEDWMVESCYLNQNQGCNTCCSSPNKIVLGINTIWDTDKWMIPIVGEDNAKKYCSNSVKKVYIKCPVCGETSTKKYSFNNIYRNKCCCDKCRGGISFPNRFMFNLLKQLNINFETEKRFEWCTYFNKYKNKECIGVYDFYIPSKNLIIEMDGGFHYKDNEINGKSYGEIELIDLEKDRLAKLHGLKVIRIDCDYKKII